MNFIFNFLFFCQSFFLKRKCGKVFCGKCSSYHLVIKGEFKRSCFDCYRAVLSEENQLTVVSKSQQPPPPLSGDLVSESNISTSTISASKRNLNTEGEEDESPLPHLIDAILAIGSHSRDNTPTLQSIRPSEADLSPETIREIISLAFPTGIHTDCFVSMNFTVRVRNKVIFFSLFYMRLYIFFILLLYYIMYHLLYYSICIFFLKLIRL